MGLCDEILKKAITIDCDNPITKGLESNGAIVNRQDIDFPQPCLMLLERISSKPLS